VRKSIVDKESLFLIGYYLPDVTIGGVLPSQHIRERGRTSLRFLTKKHLRKNC
jgi:hypothetical protein